LDQPGGGVIVTGAEVLTMLSSNEIIATMQRGARNRMVASTKSNDESSRGHAIFLITVTKHDAVNQLTQKAQLYLVDLAGSEKADKTGTHTRHSCACATCAVVRVSCAGTQHLRGSLANQSNNQSIAPRC
jgi:hypothetical protein